MSCTSKWFAFRQLSLCLDNGGQLAAEALALVHVVAGVRVLLRLALRAAPAVAVAQLSVLTNCTWDDTSITSALR